MRTLVVTTQLTLDGVMQAPGGPDEDTDGGFAHGGWSMKYWDDVMGPIMDAQIREMDALLLGRRTYDIFAAYWPRMTDPSDTIAPILNNAPKYVASKTLQKAEWNNSTVLRGDAAEEIAKLKRQAGGPIHVIGSGDLIQTLLRHDLVDEFRLWTFPLVLGTGKRLFANGTLPRSLRLADTKVSTTGVVIQRYDVAGEVQHGSSALEDQP